MKDYREFLDSLDDKKFLLIKKEIEQSPMFLSAPTDADKNFLQAVLINSQMIGMYHKWLNEE